MINEKIIYELGVPIAMVFEGQTYTSSTFNLAIIELYKQKEELDLKLKCYTINHKSEKE